VNRDSLVKDILGGRGLPADGPVWPSHWAHDSSLPVFRYKPAAITANKLQRPLTFLFPDASLERLALSVSAQLQAVGINLQPELVPLDKLYERIEAGDFDALLADARLAPTFMRPALFWHSGGPLNWGHYSNAAVDAALDSIRSAPDDATYKAGVSAFQRAIIDDPPAIFLAWSERARAVSTRFDVPVEPGRDILSTLRLWRPVADPRMRSPN
jgi:peptide/nickel transport system substrate-binding protein